MKHRSEISTTASAVLSGIVRSLFVAALAAAPSPGKTDVPVFLLSGQSNMSGYASANDLTADQKKTIENAKIYTDMTWENNGKLKKWMTLGPGFGSSASNIGPELYIGRTLSDKLPNLKIGLIKVCCGSTYLGNYASKPDDCWVPPSSNNGKAGPHYARMVSAVGTALNSFTTAFDTARYAPRWAGFVWLQGEFDGQVKSLADAYEANLTCLINDIRIDLKVGDLPVIIPMIDAQSQWQYNAIIRAAEVAVTKKQKNVDTLDTKGYTTDGTHYKAQGQVKIGAVTVERWLAMNYNYGEKVPIAFQYCRPEAPQLYRDSPFSAAILFDVSGRKIGEIEGGTLQKLAARRFFIYKHPEERSEKMR
jgi:hypothetical protein